MSSERETPTCEAFEGDLAELALGILTGRQRAATLAHVESCPRCADELEHLSRTADAVLLVAPESEPPVGFEVRLFERMGVRDVERGRWGRRPSRLVLAVAAAVVALAIGLGVGWATGSRTHVPTQAIGNPEASAALVSDGVKVGHVTIDGGSKPWVMMTLDDSKARGRVTCEVVMQDGSVHTVGSFVATQGYGAWGAPLHAAASSVKMAEVRSASGAVIATAPLH
ncbi:MAG TPA: hypothetical protein VGG38_03465 [Acidimicrobiales bacterium]|jgi:hypothetical protein